MGKRIASAAMSSLIWGSGQFFMKKQRIKGIFFFLVQVVLIGIELGTGYWVETLAGYVNVFRIRLHGGFFTKGIWGILTLGEFPGVKSGDNSMFLMIQGIIAVVTLALFLLLYLINVRDAYSIQGETVKGNHKLLSVFRSSLNKRLEYIIAVGIALIILFVVFIPILFTFLTAFTNYNREHLPPANLISWVGMDNIKKLFDVPIWSSTFFGVLGWTVIWAVSATFSTYLLGMFQALILNHPYVKLKKLFRTILILPWAIPQMISLLVFRNLLNAQFGPINQLLINLGLIREKIPFLIDPNIARITVIMVNLWLGFPMFMVMMLGVLANLDRSVYEAARVDGAAGFQVFRKITFPLVIRATAPLLILNLAGNFNGFGAIYFLTEGGPINPAYQFAGSTDILISWVYTLTLDQQMYNMAAVMSILIFLIVGAVSFWNLRRTASYKE